MSVPEALRLARELGYDLVEVSPKAQPPVCRIIDYGKFKYEQKKRVHEARKHQTYIQIKEVKLRPSIDEHDLQVKIKHVFRFLSEGNRAKVVVVFRGREISYQQPGRQIMERIAKELEEHAIVEQTPKMEGRNLVMIFSPSSKVRPKVEEKGEA